MFARYRVMLPCVQPSFNPIEIISNTQPFVIRAYLHHFIVFSKQKLAGLLSRVGGLGTQRHQAEPANSVVGISGVHRLAFKSFELPPGIALFNGLAFIKHFLSSGQGNFQFGITPVVYKHTYWHNG